MQSSTIEVSLMITINPDTIKANQVLAAIRKNDGYCPCKLLKNDDTKCMCKEFRDTTEGICQCGLYIKKNDN